MTHPPTMPSDEQGTQTWACHINAGAISALVVLECAGDNPPAIHALASIRRGMSPGRALAAHGFRPANGWLTRSWGSIARVQQATHL